MAEDKRRLDILRPAQNDLQLIKEFHPRDGRQLVLAIYEDMEGLCGSPELGPSLAGKIAEAGNYRYLASGNFLIIYRSKGQLLRIYRVFDARQDWLNELDL